MKDQRITFETAKLAKEKGFQWRILQWVDPPYPGGAPRIVSQDGAGEEYNNPCFSKEGKEIVPKYYSPVNPHYPRPTQSLLNRWLREKYKIYVTCGQAIKKSWIYAIGRIDEGIEYDTDKLYASYEEAMEAGLQEALKLIKNE